MIESSFLRKKQNTSKKVLKSEVQQKVFREGNIKLITEAITF